MIVIADMEDDTNVPVEKYYFNHSVFTDIYKIIEKSSYVSGVKTSLIADHERFVQEEYREVIDI